VASEYERARPSYPDEAVAWLADRLGIGPGSAVVDLGAGTGKLSRQIAALGAHVIAVEPLDGMRVELERALPDVEAVSGTAEAIPVPDASVDAITCGQAFHWFDTDPALREMWRVLRPGGGVGLIWNLRDDSDPFQAQLSAIVGETDMGWNVEDDLVTAIARVDRFGEIDRMTCPHQQLLPRSQVVDRIASMSTVATLGDAERAAVYARVDEAVRAVAEPVRFTYRTEAFAFDRIP
jgi:SAM-dependent methyltransferase